MFFLARTLVLGWLVSVGTSAFAAPDGFTDCTKADLPDEKAICADPGLIQADARMVTLFKVATSLVGMGARGDVEDAQVKWLAGRHGCKADASCLRDAFEMRTEQLQKVIDTVAGRGPL